MNRFKRADGCPGYWEMCNGELRYCGYQCGGGSANSGAEPTGYSACICKQDAQQSTPTAGMGTVGTGQPVTWRRADGETKTTSSNGGGTIFGLGVQQALIAVGVGVAAYFIIKKMK